MNINILSNSIIDTSKYFRDRAYSAVNTSLTIRNWLIGYYIQNYELKGSDRANYGDKIIPELAKEIKKANIKGLDTRNLYLCKNFYNTYKHFIEAIIGIVQALSKESQDNSILHTLYAESKNQILHPVDSESKNQILHPVDSESKNQILHPVDSESKNQILHPVDSKSKNQILHPMDSELKNQIQNLLELKSIIPPKKLISKLSFSHFKVLLTINNPIKRTFYEIETIKGTWSRRELEKQISRLYFERSAISKDKNKLRTLANRKANILKPQDIIKNPFSLEFLGLPVKETVVEKDLEKALINHLQEFIIELGDGFCFEAKQKRILIGEENFFIDLVFYHRILRSHIIIELKADKFQPHYAGQLTAYLKYYKKEVKTDYDNNPIGLLLCTGKNDAMVKLFTDDLKTNTMFKHGATNKNLKTNTIFKHGTTNKNQKLCMNI